MTLDSGNKVYADIRGGSLERASNDSGVIGNIDFSGISDAASSVT